MPLHAIQRLYFAEELARLRPADEWRRYAASQRAGRIDPNPHQIDAVVFALRRIPEGGCILADEVGLGKTIEAGLVIAQLLAEGADRVLLITPKALLGQWRQELLTLFSISAIEHAPGVDLAGSGVFLVTRDFAGGRSGAESLGSVPRFDLCVIDEAHELFASVYRRFDRFGDYRPDSDQAVMAGRVREILLGTPVLLLTATPIQNSLAELWGLAQFVEPSGTLLGDLPTFREVFCAGDDRQLAEGQEHELQKRVSEICQRTLRRQAQAFMKKPFVGRRARLLGYSMSPAERQLYDDVTEYLLQPDLCAFRGNQRQLLLIGFHRRMASSVPALAASLERVAARLQAMLDGPEALDSERTASALLEDLEEDGSPPAAPDPAGLPPTGAIVAELERVREFVQRARALPSDAKAQALVRAVRTALEREGSQGKLVVFTESITTQDYLRQVLLQSGVVSDEEITLFRGDNQGPRVAQALAQWREEELPRLAGSARPSQEVAVRLALVHEFRTRSKVLISTDAGGKGLNLQFAGTLINYDLPWNPQRIEQRIGRIHRYGQTRDVLVVNFAAEGNAAQELTLEILTRKLDLFGTVLGATDEVLHEPATEAPEALPGGLAMDFETRLRRIYDRARTQEEIETELRTLRDTIAEERARFEDGHRRTTGLIENRFDEHVQQVFRRIQEALPVELAAFDRDLERVVAGYLDVLGAPWRRSEGTGGVQLVVGPCQGLPEALREGFVAHLGDARGAERVEALHMGHPLVRAALEEARAATSAPLAVRWIAPPSFDPGTRGRLRLLKIRSSGFEAVEWLVPVALLEGSDSPIDPGVVRSLLGTPAEDLDRLDVEVPDEDLDDAALEIRFSLETELAAREHERFTRAVEQIERSVEDRLLLLARRRDEARTRSREAQVAREKSIGAEARSRAQTACERAESDLQTIEAELDRLRRRNDERYARSMERAHARRARPPTVETILDVRFELVRADG